ncbi:MAG: cysteine desulfurase family protein [bacterium]
MKNVYHYLDNSAATRMDERVLEVMRPYFFDIFAVATSDFGYSPGIEAKSALTDAREILSSSLGGSPEEFIFTSGNAESSNLALKGVVMALGDKKGRHIIISNIEDFPVLHSAQVLEKQGFKVTYLKVDSQGFADLDQLRDSITDETIIVSVQHANQEIGTLQDIKKIGSICKEKGVLFHTDATHTFMRVPIDVKEVPADLITVSAHTLHGPKGVGGLFVRKGTKISKWMDGGFQEFNLRGGMENIPGNVGFAKAVELVTPDENLKLLTMRDKLMEGLLSKVPESILNGPRKERLPHNANITFRFVEGESILLHLDMRGFAVSTGSACFSRSLEASHVILAIGGDHERAHGSVRYTFGRFNSMKDVEAAIEATIDVVSSLREISPLGKGTKEE